MKLEDLEPCPFCGHKPKVGATEEDGWWSVGCGACEAEGPLMPSPDAAERAWNQRKAENRP